MKILKTAMLSLLAVTCAVAIVVAVFHFAGGGRDTDSRDRTPSVGNNEENDEPEDVVGNVSDVEEEWVDYRFLHRAASISAESGLWQFFPSIPYFDVLPGETAVLSVSATGFMGWEVDTVFANVELFDKKTDYENAYVSFIMPDEEVSIAALYTDEIPQINFDNQMEMIMASNTLREEGAADIVPASTTEWIPQPGVPLPPAFVGVAYNITAPDPIVVPEGYSTQWTFNWNFGGITDLNWLTFTPTPGPLGPGGGYIWGMPPAVGGPFTFTLEITMYETGQPVSSGTVVFFDFVTIRIWEADPPPTITTTSLPDAMVGVQYGLPGRVAAGIPIETLFFPTGSTWRWEFSEGPGIDALSGSGLSLWVDNLDNSNVAIRGTPLPTALTTPGPIFSFQLIAIPTNPAFPWLGNVDSPTYNITVWDRPVLSYIQKDVTLGGVLAPAPAPGPYAFLDGLVGVTYGHGAAIVESSTPGVGTWVYNIANNGLPASSGLILDATTGLITGTPALPASADPTLPYTYSFDVIYTTAPPTPPDTTILIIGSSETVTFTVTVWPRPVLTTAPQLPDGMQGPDPADPIPEPPEALDWYSARIDSAGIPTGTVWEVALVPAASTVLVPYNLNFASVSPENAPPYATIIGSPLNTSPSGPVTVPVTLQPTPATITANPNFSPITPAITQDYTIMIWPRHYLYVDIPGRADPGYVYRDGETMVLSPLYAGRRAVIPGQQGIVRAEIAGIPFVRWEVQIDPSRTVEIGGPTTPATIANGGRQNGWWVDGSLSSMAGYARVTMPPLSTSPLSTPPYNVYIRGVLPIQMPDIRWSETDGRVGDSTYSGSLMFTRPLGGTPPNLFGGDVGIYGRIDAQNMPLEFPQPLATWVVSEGTPVPAIPGLLAPAPGLNSTLGLNTVLPSGNMTVFSGTPSEAGTFQFRVTITLPGTMQIIVPSPDQPPYNLTILPPLGLIVGNADPRGGDVVNLADVLMLAKFVRGELTAAERAVFDIDAADIRNRGLDPTIVDLLLLVEWFSNPGVTDDLEYPIGSDRPRNPNR